MTRLGVIGDIHGNPPALNAALAEFDRRGVSGIIALGDIIGIGPFGEECAQILLGRNDIIVSVRGNHERYFINGLEPDRMNAREMSFHNWEHARLSNASKRYLRSLPVETFTDVEGVSVYSTHYPLDGHGPELDHANARKAMKQADICLYAHDHSRSITLEDGVLYADFGALGCPGAEKDVAHAGIIDIDGKTVSCECLDIKYDISPLIRKWDILDPPARTTVQRIFFGIEPYDHL